MSFYLLVKKYEKPNQHNFVTQNKIDVRITYSNKNAILNNCDIIKMNFQLCSTRTTSTLDAREKYKLKFI